LLAASQKRTRAYCTSMGFSSLGNGRVAETSLIWNCEILWSLNCEAISRVGSKLHPRQAARPAIFSLATISRVLLWEQHGAQQLARRLAGAICEAIRLKSHRACAAW